MPQWLFKPYADDETRENPIQSLFFTTDEVGNIANGLIREGIQNPFDELNDSSNPLVVKIFLSGEKYSLTPAEYAPYIEGLIDHVKSKESGLRELPDFGSEKMKFLTFEDFNTKGLRGNPNESKDIEISDRSKPHNFYYFWRNVGITGKLEDKLGRWGVGKTVFPASSRINTFFGLTVQADSNAKLLMGQSVLRKHNLEHDPKDWGYKPYGYYGTFKDESYFAEPVNDQSLLGAFASTFKLTRDLEPGLSVIVPFYKEEITMKSLEVAVLQQYFYPIIKGKLAVHIKVEDEEIVISKGSLNDIVNRLSEDLEDEDHNYKFNKKSLLSLFEFAKWSVTLPDEEFISLKSPTATNQPRWDDKLWQGLDIQLLQSKFETEKRIAFKVPVKYQNKEKGDSLKICWFKLFLQKDELLSKPEDHFVRGNISIIDVKSLDSPATRGLVVIDDPDLSNLLGDSENPAHTQWQKDSSNFINKYIHGEKCILFITNALRRIYTKLQKPAAGLDKEILQNIFFIENSVTDKLPVSPDDNSNDDEEIPSPPVPPDLIGKKPRIRVQKVMGGVKVFSSKLDLSNLPNIVMKLGYMTSRGNPIRKYREHDFQVDKSPVEIKPSGCSITKKKNNELEFTATSTEFELLLTGFDINRDLYVKLKTEYIQNDTEI